MTNLMWFLGSETSQAHKFEHGSHLFLSVFGWLSQLNLCAILNKYVIHNVFFYDIKVLNKVLIIYLTLLLW